MSSIEELASDRSEWRSHCKSSIQQFEADRVQTLKTKRVQRKTGAYLNAASFPCVICGCSCASRIGLYAHHHTHPPTWASKIRCVDRSVHHHVQTKRSNNHLSCNFRKLKRTIVIFAKQYKENNVQQKSTSTNQRCNFTMHNETFPEPLHNNTKWTKLLSCYAYSSYLRWHFRISFADDNSHCYPVAIHVNAASFLMNIRESYQPSAFHHWSQPFGRYARIAKNPPTHNKLFQWCTPYHYHHYLQCHTSGL